MELTENLLWLLKQAFYFSLTGERRDQRPRGQHGPRCADWLRPGLSGANWAVPISPRAWRCGC